VPAGAKPERCKHCGRLGVIPWTLRRDDHTKIVFRRWICVECQTSEDRQED
jgi:hypothetical protein